MSDETQNDTDTERMDLNTALATLDHGDDTHWEKDGFLSQPVYPCLAVLSEMTGTAVTREDVKNVAPDLTRTASAEIHDGDVEHADETPLACLEGETVDVVEEDELATLDDGPDPIAMMEAAFNAATPDFVRFHPSFAQVQQQFQAMLPSIREEAARNKQRGRRFGS